MTFKVQTKSDWYASLLTALVMLCLLSAVIVNLQFSWLSLTTILSCLLTLSLVAWIAPRTEVISHRFTLMLLGLGILVWCWFVQSNQVSDFGVYFRCGAEHVQNSSSLLDWSKKCESSWLPGFATYWRRSLLYTLPLGWISSGSYIALKLFNGVCHILAIALIYLYVSREAGSKAGFIAAIALCFHPEFWFSATIATSDNLVIVLELVFLGAIARLCRAPDKRIVLIVVLLLTCMELLRSVGPILVLFVVAVVPLANARKQRLHLLLAAIASIITLTGVQLLATRAGMTGLQSNGLLAALAGSGVTAPRGFDDLYNWNQYVLPNLAPDFRLSAFIGLITQDLARIWNGPTYWATKIATVFQGEGYYFFSTANALGSSDDYLIAGAPNLPRSTDMFVIVRAVSVTYCALALVGLFKLPLRIRSTVGVIFAAILLAFFIGPGEVQARYGILLAPLLCIGIASLYSTDSVSWKIVRGRALSMLMLMGGSTLVLVMVHGYATHYLNSSPTLTWKIEATAGHTCPTTSTEVQPYKVTVAARPLECEKLTMLPQRISGKITLYVSREPVIARWDTRAFPAVHLEFVLVDSSGKRTVISEVLPSLARIMKIQIPVSRDIRFIELHTKAESWENGKIALSYFHDENRVINNLNQ
ncbi:hypothetical protein E2K99_02695 [Herbaspirillum huttiense]|uniref:ArnT family glycosyltransferase n=1 Tax=Herbaspirillum huttiense TaxID=863372 RepID=UPI001066D51C|nr:hypothetical protein [Herbaspirillum huttiense]QBP73987.1 hypothetical protein E2K99_02695 [Herbaspirillum huttiense]